MSDQVRLASKTMLRAWFHERPKPPVASENYPEFLLWRLCESLCSERALGVRKWVDSLRVLLDRSKDPLGEFLGMETIANDLGCQVLELVGLIAEDAIRTNQGDLFFNSMQSVADATRLVVFRFFAAWTALNRGRLEQCVEECEKVDEPFAAVFTIHGQALLELGRCNDALEVLDIATKLSPQEPLSWFQFAKALHVAGNLSAAFEALRQCRRILPGSQEIVFYMGIVTLDLPQGEIELVLEAIGYIVREIPNYGENSAVAFTLLRLACRCRDRQKAAEIVDDIARAELSTQSDMIRSLPGVLRDFHNVGWMDLASRLLSSVAPAS